MSAHNALHIAVLPGDGIGPEVMAPALEVLRRIETDIGLSFRFEEAPAGANHYLATGRSMPRARPPPATAALPTRKERRFIFGTKFMMPSLTRSLRRESLHALAGRSRTGRCW